MEAAEAQHEQMTRVHRIDHHLLDQSRALQRGADADVLPCRSAIPAPPHSWKTRRRNVDGVRIHRISRESPIRTDRKRTNRCPGVFSRVHGERAEEEKREKRAAHVGILRFAHRERSRVLFFLSLSLPVTLHTFVFEGSHLRFSLSAKLLSRKFLPSHDFGVRAERLLFAITRRGDSGIESVAPRPLHGVSKGHCVDAEV